MGVNTPARKSALTPSSVAGAHRCFHLRDVLQRASGPDPVIDRASRAARRPRRGGRHAVPLPRAWPCTWPRPSRRWSRRCASGRRPTEPRLVRCALGSIPTKKGTRVERGGALPHELGAEEYGAGRRVALAGLVHPRTDETLNDLCVVMMHSSPRGGAATHAHHTPAGKGNIEPASRRLEPPLPPLQPVA